MVGFFDALGGLGAGLQGQGQEWQKSYALRNLGEQLQNGQIDQTQYLQQLAMQDPMAARQVAGINTPASLQEFAALQNMSQAEKDLYFQNKRAQQVVNLGGTQGIIPAQGGAPTMQIPVTLKPEDQPINAEAKAEAAAQGGARGTEIGKAEGSQEKKQIQAPQIEALLLEAEKLLPTATSGGASNLGKKGAEFFGYTTDGSASDSSLDVIGAALTASVPRFEGPQGVLDVELYKKAAGDLANPDKPTPARQAAIATIRDLNKKYLPKESNPATPATVPPSIPAAGGRVKVTSPDGKQSGTISAEEVEQAIANGWKVSP